MTDGFNLVGISVRTTNKDNQASIDLGGLWQRFFLKVYLKRFPIKFQLISFVFTRIMKAISWANTLQLLGFQLQI